MNRLKAIWLVLTMPSSGIPEAADFLEDCKDFYTERNGEPSIPPSIVESFPVHMLEPTFAEPFQIDAD